MIIFFVEHGANIHISDDYPIQVASENGYLNIVQYLVKHGADVNANNNAPLRLASENGHLNIIKYLVKHGVDISFGDYSLTLASANGHLEVVKFLVEPQKYGADNIQGVNIHMDNDEALQLAAEYNHLEVVKYLIERGTQLDDPYRDSTINALNDVLIWAIENNNLEMVIVSVESQNYENIVDIESALESATEKGYLEIINYLSKQTI